MAEKTASVKVTLNTRGAIAGVRELERATTASAKQMEGALAGAVKKSQQSLRDASGRFLPRGAKTQVLTDIKAIESASLSTAQRIKSAFKSAFGGIAGGGGGFLRGFGKGLGDFSAGGLGESAAGGLKLATAGAVAAGVVLAKQANDVFEAANRLSINARGAGKQGVDPAQLTAEFFQIAQDIRGITGEQAAEAASRYVTMTGDLDAARASLRDFAVAASASGADVGSVAETAAAIAQQFKITDPKQIREVLASLIQQGKSGAFELRDAASLFPRLAAAGAAFGLEKGVGGVKTLGGLVQIARTGTGSGEQAATAVENLLTNLKLKSDDLKQAGVKVFEGGKTRDLPSILIDAIAKVGGKDVEKKQAGLAQIFGEQGIRAINPLISQFNDVERVTGSTEAAMRALRDTISASVNAPGTWADVMEDSARAQSSSSAKVTAAMERLKARVAEGLLPRLTEFVDRLADSPEVLDAFVQALKLMTDVVEGFVLTLQDLGIIKKGASPEEREKRKLAREERRKAEQAGAALEDLQMSPEAIAKLQKDDPEKLQRLREQAFDLQAKRDVSAGAASRLEQEAQQMAIKEGRAPTEKLRKLGDTAAIDRVFLAADVAQAYAQPQGGKAAPPGKSRMEISNRELPVRIVNPGDIGLQGGGPVPIRPGYITP